MEPLYNINTVGTNQKWCDYLHVSVSWFIGQPTVCTKSYIGTLTNYVSAWVMYYTKLKFLWHN